MFSNKLLPYIKHATKLGFGIGHTLFSTITKDAKYIVKNISQGPSSFCPNKGVIETTITLGKWGTNSYSVEQIAMVPATDQGLFLFHLEFINKLIKYQISYPEHAVTGIVIDPNQNINYIVVDPSKVLEPAISLIEYIAHDW